MVFRHSAGPGLVFMLVSGLQNRHEDGHMHRVISCFAGFSEVAIDPYGTFNDVPDSRKRALMNLTQHRNNEVNLLHPGLGAEQTFQKETQNES